MNRCEKRCRQHTSSKEARYLKRMLARARRRDEKKNPGNAGTRIRDYTRGWSD